MSFPIHSDANEMSPLKNSPPSTTPPADARTQPPGGAPRASDATVGAMADRVPERDERSGRGPRERLLVVLLAALRAGPGVILAVIVVVMALVAPHFLTEQNLQNLGQQMSIVAMLAMGQLMVVLVRGIDISVGSVVSLSAVVGVTIAGTSGLGIPVMLATGAAVGVINGLLIVKGRLPQPLVVTLATLGAALGLALIVSDGEVQPQLSSVMSWAGQGFIGPIPVPVLLVLAFGGVFYVLTAKTTWGRWTYAVGGNPDAARRLGIPVDAVVFTAYVLAGTMAAVAGVLAAGRTGTADPFAGAGLELDAITAVVIGGASLFGGRGSIAGVVTGALILTVIRNGLDLRSVTPYWQTVVLGVVIVVALELDTVRRTVEERLRTRQTLRHG
jgi:ribose transport system permease protein